ncbi:MAG: RING finger protein [Polyangiaceae bacterium]
MKKTHLAACPACARHLRVDEPACPFCRVELPSWFRELKAPAPPATRLSRAALYALRVGALSTTVACGGTIGTGSSEKDSGASDAVTIGEAAYGGSPPEGGGQGDADMVGAAYGTFIGAYGGPFATDDGGIEDAPTGLDAAYGGVFVPDAAPTDASFRPDVIHIVPAYGLAPLEPEEPEN